MRCSTFIIGLQLCLPLRDLLRSYQVVCQCEALYVHNKSSIIMRSSIDYIHTKSSITTRPSTFMLSHLPPQSSLIACQAIYRYMAFDIHIGSYTTMRPYTFILGRLPLRGQYNTNHKNIFELDGNRLTIIMDTISCQIGGRWEMLRAYVGHATGIISRQLYGFRHL